MTRQNDAIDDDTRPVPVSRPVVASDVFRRAQDGDREAFAAIVRALQQPALRLATVVAGDPVEAHDVVQDAFVKAYRALPTLRDANALRPWIMRTVANQAKNSRRGQRRRQLRHLRIATARAVDDDGTEQAALAGVMGERMMQALRTLPGQDQRVLACRYLAGLSEHETAETLGVPAGTVKSRTARALERLRRTYGDREGLNADD